MSGEFSCIIRAWHAHKSELHGYLTHRIGNTHLAEHLLQETFVKALNQSEGFCNLQWL